MTSRDRWPKLVAAAHWASALLVFGLLAAGLLMTTLDPLDPMRRNLGRVHTISGNLLGLLTLVRLWARRRGPRPEPLPVPELHRKGIAVVHALLYAVILAMVATGLGTVLRTRSEWHGYLLGELPKPPSFETLASRSVHEALSLVLAALVGAHVVGVFVQEVRRGGTLRRMLPFWR